MVLKKLTLSSGEMITDAMIRCEINTKHHGDRIINIAIQVDADVFEDLATYADKYLNRKIPEILMSRIADWLEAATAYIKDAKEVDPDFR